MNINCLNQNLNLTRWFHFLCIGTCVKINALKYFLINILNMNILGTNKKNLVKSKICPFVGLLLIDTVSCFSESHINLLVLKTWESFIMNKRSPFFVTSVLIFMRDLRSFEDWFSIYWGNMTHDYTTRDKNQKGLRAFILFFFFFISACEKN